MTNSTHSATVTTLRNEPQSRKLNSAMPSAMDTKRSIHKMPPNGKTMSTGYSDDDVQTRMTIAAQKPGIDFFVARKPPNTHSSRAAAPK